MGGPEGRGRGRRPLVSSSSHRSPNETHWTDVSRAVRNCRNCAHRRLFSSGRRRRLVRLSPIPSTRSDLHIPASTRVMLPLPRLLLLFTATSLTAHNLAMAVGQEHPIFYHFQGDIDPPIAECVQRAMDLISKASCVSFERSVNEQNEEDGEVLLFKKIDDPMRCEWERRTPGNGSSTVSLGSTCGAELITCARLIVRALGVKTAEQTTDTHSILYEGSRENTCYSCAYGTCNSTNKENWTKKSCPRKHACAHSKTAAGEASWRGCMNVDVCVQHLNSCSVENVKYPCSVCCAESLCNTASSHWQSMLLVVHIALFVLLM
uniref:Uncharacterized protein n=1 Tax=Plectus sambesii TaxID=2011161 RepID=A0A914W7Q8_9BILA